MLPFVAQSENPAKLKECNESVEIPLGGACFKKFRTGSGSFTKYSGVVPD
jgi:hypothetical protein